MMHILLVEPDSVQAAAIQQTLSRKDGSSRPAHTVAIATSAQTAIAQADQKRPDAVVLELMLLAHNGIEFLHEFRSYPEWADVPVVLFTAQWIADPSSFKKMGNVTYLYKPTTSLADLKKHLDGVHV